MIDHAASFPGQRGLLFLDPCLWVVLIQVGEEIGFLVVIVPEVDHN
jgi:hypothetical protein